MASGFRFCATEMTQVPRAAARSAEPRSRCAVSCVHRLLGERLEVSASKAAS
jgi:hypothetical protein